jgi:hypothetical protein
MAQNSHPVSFVATTYRSEHWQTGQMTRCRGFVRLCWSFIVLSEELAGEKGIKNAGKFRSSVPRRHVAKAVVTKG